MKKILLSTLAVVALSIVQATADNIPITTQQLPKAAQEWLSTHYPNNKVIVALHDRDITDNDYSVRLDNGTKVEFDNNGKWESVKSNSEKLPATVIPAAIDKYIAQHFPQSPIVKIERKRYGYEVELANDLDLKFDTKGNFVGLDD